MYYTIFINLPLTALTLMPMKPETKETNTRTATSTVRRTYKPNATCLEPEITKYYPPFALLQVTCRPKTDTRTDLKKNTHTHRIIYHLRILLAFVGRCCFDPTHLWLGSLMVKQLDAVSYLSYKL